MNKIKHNSLKQRLFRFKIRIFKLKRYFFRFKLHIITPSRILIFISQLAKLSRWINNHRDIKFTDFYSSKFDYSKRLNLFQQIIEAENLNTCIDYLEFGVAKGNSIKWWMNNISDNEARFYGFDTFSGLPEDWGPFKKGDMNNNNEPPKIGDSRCKFYQGLFQQTLPNFIKQYNVENRKVIHLDADLYSSTLFVLSSISPILQKGDIIFFDEFNVPMHEFKAFTEWSNSFYINYEVLGSVNNFYQVAIKIL